MFRKAIEWGNVEPARVFPYGVPEDTLQNGLSACECSMCRLILVMSSCPRVLQFNYLGKYQPGFAKERESAFEARYSLITSSAIILVWRPFRESR